MGKPGPTLTREQWQHAALCLKRAWAGTHFTGDTERIATRNATVRWCVQWLRNRGDRKGGVRH